MSKNKILMKINKSFNKHSIFVIEVSVFFIRISELRLLFIFFQTEEEALTALRLGAVFAGDETLAHRASISIVLTNQCY